MQSRDKRILVSVALGAIATVVTTWASLWHTWSKGWDPDYAQELRWPMTPPANWPAEPELVHVSHDFARTIIGASHGLSAIAETQRSDPTITWYNMIERRSGWPCRALVRYQLSTQVMRTITPVSISTWADGLRVPLWLQNGWAHPELLPLRPLPLGFAVNTAFYGVFAWAGLTFLAPWWKRSREARRTRRGLCVRCGYAVHALATCPECGANVKVPNIASPDVLKQAKQTEA